MKESLNKIIDLIDKTGDKCVVWDSSRDKVFVILGLKSYQDLLFGFKDIKGLTEDELLNKINRDIAIWKSSQNDDDEVKELLNEQINEESESTEDTGNSLIKEDKYYFEPVDQDE